MKKRFLFVITILLLLICTSIFVACNEGDDSKNNNVCNGLTNNDGNHSKSEELASSKGLQYALNEDGDGYIVTGLGSFEGSDLVIPDTYNKKPVVEILDRAFLNCIGLKNIVIPESITYVGYEVFNGCRNIESATIPYAGKGTAIEHLGYLFGTTIYSHSMAIETSHDKYYLPSALTTVTINGTVIGESAFYGCNNLTSVTIGNSVRRIGMFAFYNCASLTSITASADEASVVAKQANAQSYSIVITDGTSICDDAFSGCVGLASITIPDSVTSIGWSAFSGCTSLTSITIPFVGATKDGTINTHFGYIFGASSYSYNSSYIPSSLKTVVITGGSGIGDRAFYECAGLTNITIPNSVTNIGKEAFSSCYKLVEVYNKSSLTITAGSKDNGYVGYYALAIYTNPYESKVSIDSNGYIIYTDGENKILVGYTGSAIELTLPSGITEINQYAFYENNRIAGVTIGNGVTSIGEGAFACYGLMSVTIGSGVTSIGNGAFCCCYKLVEVYNKSSLTITAGSKDYGYVGYYAKNIYTEEGGNKLSTDENGFVIYTDGENKILVGYTGNDTELTLPSEITEIYQYAFYDNDYITSVIISDSVTSIGDWAFFNCNRLASIKIPDSVISIGGVAFFYCSGLTSVTIGNGVTSIGDYAFSGCARLTSIEFKDWTTWYVTESFFDWENQTNGMCISVTYASTNATYLTNTYSSYFWYKK